jgi:cellulose synthase/poly-beta-1,6-N-acetylglucosamine synthase-like glycosyltransferase
MDELDGMGAASTTTQSRALSHGDSSPSHLKLALLDQAAHQPLLLDVMTRRQRTTYMLLVSAWLLALFAFWDWWFEPAHISSPVTFLLTTGILAYLLLVPGYFIGLLGRMQRPNPRLPVPTDLRVALATSFVPSSESIDVLERTLRAMKAQRDVQADVWVLDEGNVDAVRALAAELGVHYFTRHGIARYQSTQWPFKSRYKAGNYNAWLDAIGYERYDVLVQMDTDHAPAPDYLTEILRPLSDPRIAYVSAPSDTSGNREQSWLVMARVVLDAPLQGPMQMGFNRRLCPIIIGSHSALRIDALRRIGGFQHTRAEDHHNTLRLAHFGLRGVFAPEAKALGYGPTSLGEALSQEHQWARSITAVLLQFFARDATRLNIWRWLEFVFCETWYLLYSIALLVGFSMPLIAMMTNRPWVNVSYVGFMVRFEIVELAVLAIVIWTRSQGWLRPQQSPVVSWQSVLFTLARWPIILLASADAILSALLRRDLIFRVTFKGDSVRRPLEWRVLSTYFVIVFASLGAAFWYMTSHPTNRVAAGYAFLALLNGTTYTVFIVAAIILHWRDAYRLHLRAPLRGIGLKSASAFGAVALTIIVAASTVPQLTSAAFWLPANISTPRAGTTNSGTLGSYEYPPSPVAPPSGPFLGVYDPLNVTQRVQGVQVEEFFADWTQSIGAVATADVQSSEKQGRFPMLAVEPWPAPGKSKATLLHDIAAGGYAQQEDELAAALKALAPQVVYIRFGHEMDVVNAPYPWSTRDAPAYVAAFRQFVKHLRGVGVTNARYIFSPATLKSVTLGYFPGNDVVDAVGVTILISMSWPLPYSTPPTSFANYLPEQLLYASSLHLPLIVCEAGLWDRDSLHAQIWMAAMRTAALHTDGLAGVVYYDGPNSPLWNQPVDWSLTPQEAQLLFEDQGPRLWAILNR